MASVEGFKDRRLRLGVERNAHKTKPGGTFRLTFHNGARQITCVRLSFTEAADLCDALHEEFRRHYRSAG